MTGLGSVSRRATLTMGGSLVLAFALPRRLRAANSAVTTGALDGFVRIASDRTITFVIPSVEMGQGIYTAEAMLIAEELEVGLDQIQVVAAPPDGSLYAQPLFGSQLTGGSTSIRGFFDPLRSVGATARTMLVGAAAARWGAATSDCAASRAVVTHQPSGRTIAYADLVDDARRLPVPLTVPLKPESAFALVGKSAKRLDTPGKVNGSAKFGLDVRVAGMKTAAVAMAPVPGGRLRQLVENNVRSMPGVVDVLRLEDAVAVVGEHYWAARKGLAALSLDWDLGALAGMSSASLRAEQEAASMAGSPIRGRADAAAAQALGDAARQVSATYELPFLAHATMEPINTTVHVRPDGCDIWVGTQVPLVAQRLGAEITGLPLDRVAVHNQLIGGGFGRRLMADTVEQAVRFARQVPYPLKVVWSREQDIRNDRFRPSYYDRISAGLDRDGAPVAWNHRVTSGTVRKYFDQDGWPEGKLDPDAVSGAANTPYALGKMIVEWVRHDPPVAVNWWRGVGETHNVFVVESFLDELAHTAGRDPVAYRRALLADNPRSLAVLDLAAMKAGWGTTLPPGHGRGVSLHESFGTRAAVVIEVSVTAGGDVTVRRAVAAVDPGIAVNPDSIRAQIEGGLIFGLSAALHNEITFVGGQVEQSNFNDYRQMRINEAPSIEVHIAPSGRPPGGMGEVGTVSAAPALGNAIFAATGRRLRTLPFDRAQPAVIAAVEGKRVAAE
jgi:isoquinoline 1-oxidoreductase beta subunit